MSKPDVWMPLYIADYLADTARLTTEQHGAYLLLIMDYWRNGALPDDDSVLSTITKLSPEQWSKHRPSIARMFSVHAGEWRHKRIDAELQEAEENAKRRKDKAKGAAEARWGKKSDENDGVNASGNATSTASSTTQAELGECPSPSPSPKEISPERVEITPHSSANAQEGIGAVTPTEAGLMSKALRERNVTITSSNPELLSWIAAGATIPLVLDALAEARVQKPEPEKIPARYLGAVVMRLLSQPAARASPQVNKQAVLEESNRRVVEESVRRFNEEQSDQGVERAAS